MAAGRSKKMKMNKINNFHGSTATDIEDRSCYVLTNFSQILKQILIGLPVKSLNSCARVCKIWNDAVQKIKKLRCPYYWNYFEGEEESPDSQKLLLESIQLTIENLPIEPETMLVYYTSVLLDTTCTSATVSTKSRSKRKIQKECSDVSEFFQNLLPRSCQTTAVAADGIIGTSSSLRKTKEFENKCALSFICFAKQSTFSFHSIQLDVKQGTKLGELWNSNEETSFSNFIPPEETVKSVLFFSDDVTCPQELGFALYKEYNQPLIAGGFVDSLVFPSLLHDINHKHDLPTICCVALCGETVKIASIIIRDDVCDKTDVEACMKELKSHDLPEERSFAFMFACVGRGENHYGEADVESMMFRKFFPKTPLLGLFGNGEVGFKYPLPPIVSKEIDGTELHDFVNDSRRYLTRHPPKLYHAYTTVLCLVSLP
ncbi:F-box only protein 22 [Patella vulgata]|uniref:F-box only protein 22 n=1 Tax=Patella vulgata TaxID=6465 RepID=UPI0024A82907|nr:F-box only protein 22 [Patella vulgata]